MVGRCRLFPHDLPELIMSIGPLYDRKDGNAHFLPSAAAGIEMCSMEEGIGVPRESARFFHGLCPPKEHWRDILNESPKLH